MIDAEHRRTGGIRKNTREGKEMVHLNQRGNVSSKRLIEADNLRPRMLTQL